MFLTGLFKGLWGWRDPSWHSPAHSYKGQEPLHVLPPNNLTKQLHIISSEPQENVQRQTLLTLPFYRSGVWKPGKQTTDPGGIAWRYQRQDVLLTSRCSLLFLLYHSAHPTSFSEPTLLFWALQGTHSHSISAGQAWAPRNASWGSAKNHVLGRMPSASSLVPMEGCTSSMMGQLKEALGMSWFLRMTS